MPVETVPGLTPLPTTPNRQTQSGNTLSNNMDAFSFALGPWGDEIKLIGDNVYNNALEAEGFASNASASAGAASSAQSAAEGFRNEAEGFKDSAEAAAIAAQAGAGLPAMTQNGDVLTITDAGTNAVAFQAPPKGGLVPLLTVNASTVSAIDFTGLDAYGYDNYIIDYSLQLDTGTLENLVFLVSTNNGVSFDSSGAGVYATIESKAAFTSPSTANSTLNFNNSNALTGLLFSSHSLHCRMTISNLQDGYTAINSNRTEYEVSSNTVYAVTGSAVRKNIQIDNAIRLALSTNTMSGKVTLYGVAEA